MSFGRNGQLLRGMQGWALLVLLAATDAIDAANETVTTAPTGEVETRLPPGERSLEEEGRAAGETYDRGAAHAAHGRFDVAIGELLDAAARADALAGAAHYVLGWVHQSRGELGGAAGHYAASLDRRPRSPEATANLAVVYGALGHGTKALALAEAAVALAPNREDFARNLKVLRSRPTADVEAQTTYACRALPDGGARALPNVLLVSPPKTGSTALYADITAHPRAVGGTCKETRYWPIPSATAWASATYRAFFPTRAEAEAREWTAVVDGGGTYGTAAAVAAGAPAQVARLMPASTKVVGLLRDPVLRFISVYAGRVTRDGYRGTCGSFLDASREAGNGTRAAADAAAPLADGRYARGVAAWTAALGVDRALYLPSALPGSLGLALAFAGLDAGAYGRRPSEDAHVGSDNVRSYRDTASAPFFAARAGGGDWACDERALAAYYDDDAGALLAALRLDDRPPAVGAAWRRDPWFCARVGPALCGA